MHLKRIYKFKNVGLESAYLIHMYTPWGGGNVKKIFALEKLTGNAKNNHICFLVSLYSSAGFCNDTTLCRGGISICA